ncbi:MAG: FtsX-like permease family protein [Bacteroidota bacterium]|nr:FtsX-like permease family protein [Bacteroidota bacterium]
MKFGINLKIAKTHLLAKKKQTLVAMLGVTFGIAMFTLMISFMTGVNNLLEDTMLSASPDIHIYNDIKPVKNSILDDYYNNDKSHLNITHHQHVKEQQRNLKNGWEIVQYLKKDNRIKGISAQLATQVFYRQAGIEMNGVLSGVDIFEEDKLFELSKKMKFGKIEDLKNTSNGVIMGVGLARKLNLRVGDKINVSTPLATSQRLKIVGIFGMGVAAIDNTKCYTNLPTVQKLLLVDPNYISDINIKLTEHRDAKPMAGDLEKQLGYKCEDWETSNATLLISFTIRSILTFVVVTTLLVVAGFGIYNIMNMTIYDKMKDIAILKATGFSGGDIVRIFLSQSLIIGLLGGLSGILLGLGLSYGLSKVPFDGGEFLAIDHLPITFDIKYYIQGIVFGLATTAFAGYFPAKKASKVDPVKIIRG